jgi:flagellin-specific chaperone FliS
MSLYVYFNRELFLANIHRDRKKIITVLDMMSSLRDSWAIAANTAQIPETGKVFNTVDING